MTSVMRPDPRYELALASQVPHTQTEHPDTSAVAVTLSYLLTYIRGPCTAWTPPSRKIIAPEASTLPHLMVFLILTF